MLNKVILLGRVGSKDVQNLKSGMLGARISLYTFKKFIDKDGVKQDKKLSHTVKAYGKVAEIIEKYVGIGDLLYLEGEIEKQEYTDKNGIERLSFCVIASMVKLIPKVDKNKQAGQDFDSQDTPF